VIRKDAKILLWVGVAIILVICCLGSLAVIFFSFSDQSPAIFGSASPAAPQPVRRPATPSEEAPSAIYVGDATATTSPTALNQSGATSTRTPPVGYRTPTKSPVGCPRGCIPPPPSGCLIKGNIFQGQKLYLLPSSKYYDQASIDPSQGDRWFCTEQEAIANGWRKGE
jgi:hypothetical protein